MLQNAEEKQNLNDNVESKNPHSKSNQNIQDSKSLHDSAITHDKESLPLDSQSLQTHTSSHQLQSLETPENTPPFT